MAITPSDFSKIWASNADTPEYTFSEANYLKGWDFVGNLPPTRAQWNAMQKSTDEKMKYVFDNFGAPLTASTVAEMTLENRVYVYTGSEVGYTAGDWYYYDEGTSTWVDGGVYNAVAVVTDKTLTQAGVPADAKATGGVKANLVAMDNNTNKKVFFQADLHNFSYIPCKTGTGITNSTKVIDVDIPNGTSYTIEVKDPDSCINGVISFYAINSGGSPTFVGSKNAGVKASYTASFDIKGFSLYVGGSNVINTGSLEISVEYKSTTNSNSLENVLNTSINSICDGNENIPYTESVGFIGSNGTISGGTAPAYEKYTNKIPVTEGETLYITVSYPSSNAGWLCVATYDSTNTFIERITLDDTFTTETTKTYTATNGVSSVAFTYRTYNVADVQIFKPMEFVEDFEERITQNETDITTLTEYTGTSRNIFDDKEFIWEKKLYNSAAQFVDSASNSTTAVAPVIPVTGGQTYTFSWGGISVADSGAYFYIHEFNNGNTRVKYTSTPIAHKKIALQLDANTVKVGLMVYMANNTNWQDIIPLNMQIEAGTTETEYVPHNIIKTARIDILNLCNAIEKYIGAFVNPNLPSVTIKNIAHRGDDHVAPQCTAPAYVEAKKRGFSIAENDLFYSQDNKLVMWHDTTLVRLGNMVDINGYLMYTDGTDYYWVHPTTNAVYTWDGTQYVASSVVVTSLTRCNGSNYSVNNQYEPTTIGLNFDVLRRIDFGLWKGSQFRGTQILTFEEWILLCKQLGMGAYVDRKLTYTDALLTEAANTVKRLGMGEYTSWLDLNGNQINLLRTIIPHARCGVLTHPTAQNVISYAPYNVDGKFFFNGDARNGMTAGAIHTGLDAGFEVEVWYVEYGATSEEQILAKIREAVSYGVTGITLDHYRTNDAFAYLLE